MGYFPKLWIFHSVEQGLVLTHCYRLFSVCIPRRVQCMTDELLQVYTGNHLHIKSLYTSLHFALYRHRIAALDLKNDTNDVWILFQLIEHYCDCKFGFWQIAQDLTTWMSHCSSLHCAQYRNMNWMQIKLNDGNASIHYVNSKQTRFLQKNGINEQTLHIIIIFMYWYV